MSKDWFSSKCDKIAMAFLCVLMADCSIFGAGRVVTVGPISFRQILLLVLLLVSVPLVLKKVNALVRCPGAWVVLIFLVWAAVSAVVGVKNGNRMSLIITDLKGFSYFVALPAVICVLSSRERVHTLMHTIMYASAVLALITIGYLCMYVWFPEVADGVITAGHEIMFSRISTITDRIPRLFFHSELYLICGCGFAIYFHITEDKRSSDWIYIVITGLCLFALLLSYTRSIYLATFVAAVGVCFSVALFNLRRAGKKLLIHICSAACVCLLLAVILSIAVGTNYVEYAVSRTMLHSTETVEKLEINSESGTGKNPQKQVNNQGANQHSGLTGKDDSTEDDTEETKKDNTEKTKEQQQKQMFNQHTIISDQLRMQTRTELLENIKKAPLCGLGLGAEIPSREDGLNEYFYLDLWSKTGIIGVILYLLPALWMLVSLLAPKGRASIRLRGVWLSVLGAFLIYSFFNPYMNASLGILFYCCTIGVVQCQKSKRNIEISGTSSGTISEEHVSYTERKEDVT